jgi:O-antigen ligase
MGCFAALAVGAAALASEEVRDFFVFLATRGHEAQNLESFGGRLGVWEYGLQVFTEHPLLGTGYGTYPAGMEGHFHNLFIELLVTTGMVGLVGYIAFLVALITLTRRSIRQANPQVVADRIMTTDLATILTVILVANGAAATAAYYSWDLLGLVSVGVAASLLMVRRSAGSEEHAAHAAQIRFSNLLR